MVKHFRLVHAFILILKYFDTVFTAHVNELASKSVFMV